MQEEKKIKAKAKIKNIIIKILKFFGYEKVS